MNGPMLNCKTNTDTYTKYPGELTGIKIDYAALVAYSTQKGLQPVQLSDEEKKRFIIGSSMDQIRQLQRQYGVAVV